MKYAGHKTAAPSLPRKRRTSADLLPVPVIDLFAGPGGLGEGFSSVSVSGKPFFRLGLSVEKDVTAHQTLELRSFFRKFSPSKVPEDYYRFLRGEIDRATLFERHPAQSQAAKHEALCAELGSDTLTLPRKQLDAKIREAIGTHPAWVLIGGPPCQAYSLAGRSRNKRLSSAKTDADPRHFLYREYLRVLGTHWPTAFVMENVTGILSSKVKGQSIFQRILEDLQDPRTALGEPYAGDRGYDGYRIFSLIKESEGFDLFGLPEHDHSAYVINSEEYGIPQMRHRVILLGIRHDIAIAPKLLKKADSPVTARHVLEGLPRLRSGISKATDSSDEWTAIIRESLQQTWFDDVRRKAGKEVQSLLVKTVQRLSAPRHGRGGEFVRHRATSLYRQDWYIDQRIQGVCNSATRAHICEDLYRYIYAACFTQVKGRSPRLSDFPEALHPDHSNIGESLRHGNFSDRFRVQLRGEPSTTVVSHIAKDGHYYIHYDPSQCRSLTVREAARLQTFPDNYFFCGNRTEQYTQVGNAVPPLLAGQIAHVVKDLLETSGLLNTNGHTFPRPPQLEHVEDSR